MGLVGEREEGRERRERVVSHFALIHETTALSVVLCRESLGQFLSNWSSACLVYSKIS